jgi:antitoxin (DNA-binding transcriptional repressor) of toxin-antitoxin stability system
MKTIGAKEFRLHMNEVLDRVIAGEEIVIKHRFKPAVRLVAEKVQRPKNSGEVIGKKLDTLLPELRKHKNNLDPDKSYKELYADSLRKSRKYGKYFS